MTLVGLIEEFSRRGTDEVSVEWQIPNFPSLPDGRDISYFSPTFSIGDVSWCLSMWPNYEREARNPASGWVTLSLCRRDGGPPATFRFCVGIRGSGGVEKSREGEKKFEDYDGYYWDDFCSRSDLLEHRTRLMPDDTFTIRCVLKRIGAATELIKTLQQRVENYEFELVDHKKQISNLESEKLSIAEEHKCLLEEKLTLVSGLEKDNDLLKKEVEFYVEQIQTLQKRVENYELELDHKKEISALENEMLSIAEEYKCLFEEKLTFVTGLEKENEVLREEMKTLIQQIKDYVKCNDVYCSEIISYKSKITDLENKLLFNEKNYEERIQINLDESSKMRKDNDLLKKEVEFFMEQIKTLQQRVENYELELEDHKKQISASESEKLSIAEEYKCLLKEKLTLEKVNEQLKKEMESLMEQNKDLNELCEEQTHNISKASSELRKACMDNESLKKEMESLMEQIKILKKTAENYETRSENYSKQMSTLESGIISGAEPYKCREKLTIVSGLEKAAIDDDAVEKNNNDADHEESKNKKNGKQPCQVKSTKKISLPSRHGDVIRSLKAILAGGRRADFTLKSGGGEWPVHRAILEGRSGHFEALFRGEWAERSEVRLDDVPEGALDGVLHFLYAGEVGDLSAESACGTYAAAHRFLLRDLKSLCVECMEGRMGPEMACGALAVAEAHGEGEGDGVLLPGIRQNCRHGGMEGAEGESSGSYW